MSYQDDDDGSYRGGEEEEVGPLEFENDIDFSNNNEGNEEEDYNLAPDHHLFNN